MEPEPVGNRRSGAMAPSLDASVELRDGVYTGAVSRVCKAPPETVYALLADLNAHLAWGGRQSGMHQRPLVMSAPPGPATVGTTFSSIGYTSHGLWRDRSRVRAAVPPSLFEFETAGSMDGDMPVGGRWVHRYEIEPSEVGCLVTYQCQWELSRPVRGGHRLRRAIFCKVVLPTIWAAGLQGLTEMAEARGK